MTSYTYYGRTDYSYSEKEQTDLLKSLNELIGQILSVVKEMICE